MQLFWSFSFSAEWDGCNYRIVRIAPKKGVCAQFINCTRSGKCAEPVLSGEFQHLGSMLHGFIYRVARRYHAGDIRK